MIIGLHGKIGAGKDTVADFLVKNYDFTKVGYSDVLYDAICTLWHISKKEALAWKDSNKQVVVVDNQFPTTTVTHPFTWREHLQRFGTEMGREVFGPDFWIDQFNQRYLDDIEDDDFYALNLVIRDVRFNNEAENIVDFGGDIWQVIRPGYEGDEHVSEAGIDPKFLRGDIGNDGTIEELHTLLQDWMLAAYGPRHSVSGS